MREHLHLLVTLGEQVDLPQAVRLFKGRLSTTRRAAGLNWQRGYFDHRLRAEEDRLPVFRYILLNPYRARLAGVGEEWGGYFCAPEDWAWFGPITDEEQPMPEWLGGGSGVARLSR